MAFFHADFCNCAWLKVFALCELHQWCMIYQCIYISSNPDELSRCYCLLPSHISVSSNCRGTLLPEQLISRYFSAIYITLSQQLWQTVLVEPVSHIYFIKPTCCQNNPTESILWMHLHQFQYLSLLDIWHSSMGNVRIPICIESPFLHTLCFLTHRALYKS